uniref:Mindbomb E3 ubiquitin protein ligase 2 n=1 Tax=Rousettus aegyptiacus TaxID=9407 RepID=A0A7J8KCI1_ROUAE|nr:mindbomb E3 ubiquitin protein ligase 2 [Rousettus aegyptiacus]
MPMPTHRCTVPSQRAPVPVALWRSSPQCQASTSRPPTAKASPCCTTLPSRATCCEFGAGTQLAARLLQTPGHSGDAPSPATSPCSHRAVRRVLARARQLVDAKKEDGFTALHLAALNNHWEVAQTLIREGRCDVNVRNHKLQSALHLAVRQAHVRLVLLLVDAGCSVNAEDEEGDTALHVALRHHQLLPLAADGAGGDPGPLQLLSRLQASGLPSCAELTVSKAVACYLALEGADVSYANHRGLSPLDLVAEGHVLKALQGCAQRFR